MAFFRFSSTLKKIDRLHLTLLRFMYYCTDSAQDFFDYCTQWLLIECTEKLLRSSNEQCLLFQLFWRSPRASCCFVDWGQWRRGTPTRPTSSSSCTTTCGPRCPYTATPTWSLLISSAWLRSRWCSTTVREECDRHACLWLTMIMMMMMMMMMMMLANKHALCGSCYASFLPDRRVQSISRQSADGSAAWHSGHLWWVSVAQWMMAVCCCACMLIHPPLSRGRQASSGAGGRTWSSRACSPRRAINCNHTYHPLSSSS